MNPRGAFYTPYSLSRGAPSATWVLLHSRTLYEIRLAERVGFEPTDAFTSPVFKTGAFDHSAISPCVKVHSTQTQDLLYHRGLCLSTINKERKDVFSRKNGLTFVGGGGIINKLIPFRECKSEYPGVAKFGIALEWGSRGLEFESRHSDQS